ncbi:hypothetical protein VL20_2680 [Microcystis panniformis FACHB-1757]|uniref:Uncharacterized protein n=1 Tax=Microcystis panniformis FACHB-1757 TaxID=1638788 RepID=A0A0K1S111_9CHRO|nr:hypothetical protein VL20_2680 [Microcystis panniformis FACHB-1757]
MFFLKPEFNKIFSALLVVILTTFAVIACFIGEQNPPNYP